MAHCSRDPTDTVQTQLMGCVCLTWRHVCLSIAQIHVLAPYMFFFFYQMFFYLPSFITTSQNYKPRSPKMAKYIHLTLLKCKYEIDEIESLSLVKKKAALKLYF